MYILEKFPSYYLQCVDTLHCEIQKSKNVTELLR